MHQDADKVESSHRVRLDRHRLAGESMWKESGDLPAILAVHPQPRANTKLPISCSPL